MNLQTFVEENESKSNGEFSNRGDSLKKKTAAKKVRCKVPVLLVHLSNFRERSR